MSVHYDVVLRPRAYPEEAVTLAGEFLEPDRARLFGRGAQAVMDHHDRTYEGHELVVVTVDSETYQPTGEEDVL